MVVQANRFNDLLPIAICKSATLNKLSELNNVKLLTWILFFKT